MGHKVHPVGFRVGVIRGWDAKWYADKHYVTYLQEDMKVRKAIRSMYPEAGVSQVEIDRQANAVTLTIHTARPGILIGRGGQRVDEMRNNLEKLIGKKIQLNIREVQQPELDAFLVARSVADQMERRVAYRRAMKQSLLRTVQAGAKGMRIRCAGRLDGAEIARKVIMHEGRVPLHTIRADVDYGLTEAHTVMGRIGVKVWIYKGDILPEKEEVEAVEAVGIATAETKPAETAPEAAAAATATQAPEAVVAETKPSEQPVSEEKPKPVRRAPRARTTVTPAPGEAAAPFEEKPKSAARRAPRPKIAAPETKTEETASEEKPKAAVKRAPRTSVKPKETKSESAVEAQPPAEAPTAAETQISAETTDKQGEGNVTT
jgi:small subunit ribosomal protein S3